MTADPFLTREYGGELRARVADPGSSDERIIEGVVIPYGAVANVRDTPTGPRYRETIARGAVAGLDPTKVQLQSLTAEGPGGHNTHAGAILVGRGIAADDDDQRLHMSFKVARTRDGDELLELARDGVLTRFSAGFMPGEERRRPDGVIERTRIDLRRVAVVGIGAYEGADVTAVRAAAEGMNVAQEPAAAAADIDETETEDAEGAPPKTKTGKVRVNVEYERAAADDEKARAGAERDTEAMLTRAGAPRGGLPGAWITRPEAVYGPRSEHGFLSDGYAAARKGDAQAAERQHRHYQHLADVAVELERATSWDSAGMLHRAGDVLSSELPGAYPNDYLPGLLTPRILKGRPMADFYDRVSIADARPRIFPKVTTSSTVSVQSAEGAALSSTDVATTAVTVTPSLYGAYTDVSKQAIDGADPAAQNMVLQDLIEGYSQTAEAAVKTAVEAGSSASGVAITAATPYAGTLQNVINYFAVRFRGGTGAFIPSALFPVLAAQGDTTGRPFLPMIGAVNSDGQTLADDLSLELAVLTARTKLSYQSTANVCVFARPTDFVIFESAIAQFSYDQIVGPHAIRVGIDAYLGIGARLGSLKVTAA